MREDGLLGCFLGEEEMCMCGEGLRMRDKEVARGIHEVFPCEVR